MITITVKSPFKIILTEQRPSKYAAKQRARYLKHSYPEDHQIIIQHPDGREQRV